jgi:replicative DNA helicase
MSSPCDTPPQAVLDAEHDVLGAVFGAASLDVDAGFRIFDRIVATGLDPNDFYRRSLGALFARLLDLRERSVPLDPVSVGVELERDGTDPTVVARLHQLAHEAVAFSPCERWAALVAAEGRSRRVAE